MSEKEMCQILSDLIAVSDRPVVVNGTIYSERSGNVFLAQEAKEAILELMARQYCRKTEYGTYTCYEKTLSGVEVDGCLVGEINRLNNSGIKTIGCCCGHGKQQGYIQVDPLFLAGMEARGYERIEVDDFGNGEWCFKPKTALPKPAGCTISEYAESCGECGFCDLKQMENAELIKALKEDAEWAHANEWETPITLGDHLDAAADALEAADTSLADCRNELCLKCGKYKTAHEGSCDGCRWKEK